jgi:2-deoxy-D-gluconate 3-dehydrogenase
MLECFELKGMVAVVTGASRGLGKAICIALAQAGSDIVGCARDMDSLTQTMDEVKKLGRRSLGLKVDITSSHDVKIMVERAIAEYGEIDILVNNAGIILFKPLVEQSEEEWTNVINTNLRGMFYCCKEVGKHMIKRKFGKVINMSSIRGFIGSPNETSYCATKGAIIQLTKALALEWAKFNINVNAVAPGFINTDMAAQAYNKNKELREKILHVIPLRRIGKPEEVGTLVVYLASKAADFITGETVVIDGGLIIK